MCVYETDISIDICMVNWIYRAVYKFFFCTFQCQVDHTKYTKMNVTPGLVSMMHHFRSSVRFALTRNAADTSLMTPSEF